MATKKKNTTKKRSKKISKYDKKYKVPGTFNDLLSMAIDTGKKKMKD